MAFFLGWDASPFYIATLSPFLLEENFWKFFAPKYLFKCDYMHGVVCQLILLLFVIDYRTLIFF